jgi:hypothetical protein
MSRSFLLRRGRQRPTPPRPIIPAVETDGLSVAVRNVRRPIPTWTDYSFQKNAWIAAHPEATHEDIELAARAIASRLEL